MKRTKYPIHSDFKKWSNMNPPLIKGMLPIMQTLLKALFLKEKSSKELIVERKKIPVEQGKTISALLYSPVGAAKNVPCLVYYHGGGFVLPAAPYHYSLAKIYALQTSCKVLFVNYRLAPKHRFPTAPEDCYAAYSWLIQNANQYSVNPAHIAVAGDSAGGELATVVCLMAREHGIVMPCGQMLLYPVVANEIETESMKKYTDTPMCNSRDIKKYSNFYLPKPFVGNYEYASPLEAKSLKGLPQAYLETAEFDCLREEGILYAKRLQESGVSTELVNTEGTMHGFDIVLNSPIVQACIDKRIAFLKKIFAGNNQ